MDVSVPLSWEQLSELKSGAPWSVQTAREYLSFQAQDPWVAYWTAAQLLESAIRRLQ
jgi:bifunctional non-homologous end joining protein LigD